jgi:hypothetical protein
MRHQQRKTFMTRKKVMISASYCLLAYSLHLVHFYLTEILPSSYVRRQYVICSIVCN